MKFADRKELQRLTRRLLAELREAAANPSGLSRRTQLEAWRRGFPARQAALYDFERYGFDPYLTELERQRRVPRLNRGGHSLVRDKLLSYLYLREIGTPTPKVHAVVQSGRTIMLDRESGARDLDELLSHHGRLVVKPRDGAFGRQVLLLERAGGRTTVNGRETGDPLAQIDGPAIVTEHVVSHDYARAIFPDALNTLRVLCLRDPKGGEPFAIAASHRFGTSRSKPVDNASSGGISGEVDVETGRIGALLALPGWYLDPGERPTWMPAHPETGVQVEGVVVPRWQELVAELNRTMAQLPGLNWVGWDVAVTPDRFTVIEGNGGTDVTFQVFRPLLLDPRVREVFERNDLLIGRGRRRRNGAAAG